VAARSGFKSFINFKNLPPVAEERTMLSEAYDAERTARVTKAECLITLFLFGAESSRADAPSAIKTFRDELSSHHIGPEHMHQFLLTESDAIVAPLSKVKPLASKVALKT
jgi:hypothetical protein